MRDLDQLRVLGDHIVPPPLDTLRDTARARDRRLLAVVTTGGAAAILAAGTTFLLIDDDQVDAQPVDPPETVEVTRSIAYADGSTIHLGDQSIDAGSEVLEVDATDDGVAFRSDDGQIWFTDMESTEAIGQLGQPQAPGPDLEENWPGDFRYWPVKYATGWMVSANAGSNLAWFDFTDPEAPRVVVYDTDAREVVLETDVALSAGSWAGLHSVTDESTFWFLDPDSFAGDHVPQVRLDLASGEQSAVTPEEYAADIAARPARTLQISHAEQGFNVYETIEGPGQQFAITRERFDPMGMQPIAVRDGLTEKRFALEAPTGYPNSNPVWLVQWLDDDTVVMRASRDDRVDLLECSLSAGACTVAVTLPDTIVVPGI